MDLLGHLLQLGAALLVCSGPLPLGLALALRCKCSSWSCAAVTCCLAWLASQILVGLALGSMGLLILPALLAAEAALLALGLALLRFAPAGVGLSDMSPLRSWSALSRGAKFLVVLIAFLALSLAWSVFSTPTTDYDSLTYRLPTVVTWLQNGDLTRLHFSPEVEGYPYNLEVAAALCILPFGEDFIFALPSLLAWALLGLGVYRLAVELGGRKVVSLAAVCVFLLMPLLLRKVNSMQVDIALAAFFLAGLYFVVRYLRTRSPWPLALALTSAALMLGTKTSGFVYAVILLIAFALLRLLDLPPKSETAPIPPASPAVFWLAVVAVCLVLGGYWYARNLVEFGNPFCDVRFSLAGFTLFDGSLDYRTILSNSMAALFNPLSSADWDSLCRHAIEQFGLLAFLFPFVLIRCVILVIRSVSTKQAYDRNHHRLHLTLTLLILLAFFAYWNTPYSAGAPKNGTEITVALGDSLRFAFPCVALLTVLAVIPFSSEKNNYKLPRLMVLVLYFLFLTFFLSYIRSAGLLPSITPFVPLITPLIFIMIICAVLCGIIWLFMDEWNLRPLLKKAKRIFFTFFTFFTFFNFFTFTAIACIFIFPALTWTAREYREGKRKQHYGSVYTSLLRTTETGERIELLPSHLTYVFYGRNLDSRMEHNYRSAGNALQWLRLLEERGIRYVAVGAAAPGWEARRELGWIELYNGYFHPETEGSAELPQKIYRVGALAQYKGTTAAVRYPPNVTSVELEAKTDRENQTVSQYLSIKINGSSAGVWPLNHEGRTINLDLHRFSRNSNSNELAFEYSYALTYPNWAYSRLIPFDLQVQSGGTDPNQCYVYLHGRYLMREKGYNAYVIGPDGSLVEQRNFNTAWYPEASRSLAGFLSSLECSDCYLLLVTRFDAGRNLTAAGVRALEGLGLGEDIGGKEHHNHLALIRLSDSKVIVESSGPGRQEISIGEYSPNSGFVIDVLEVRRSRERPR